MITKKLRECIKRTGPSELSNDCRDNIVNCVLEIEEELKKYIKGPVDIEGKPFVCGCDIEAPGYGKNPIEDVRTLQYDFARNMWAVVVLDGMPLLYWLDECLIVETDTLKKIKEDAKIPYNLYCGKYLLDYIGSGEGAKKKALHLVERTEKVLRREYEK